MASQLSFRLKEAYKKFTKQSAINIMKLIWGAVKPDPRPPASFSSVVILAQERYGDIIVLTPLFNILREKFPQINLTVLGVTDIVYFLKSDPNLNLVCNIKRADKAVRKSILAQKYDLLYNTKDHPSFTFLKLTARIKAAYKVGIYHPRHAGFFHHMIELADAQPTIEKNAALLPLLGVTIVNGDLRPYMPAGETAAEIADFIDETTRKELVGINLSASNRTKEWGIERWREFLGQIDEKVIILSAPGYVDQKRQLESEFDHVIPTPLTPTVHDVGVLVDHLKLLVTPDTSLVHIASCFNTPIVALYRLERDMKKFPPLSDRKRIHVTPTGEIDDIPASEVLASYRSILADIHSA